MVNWLFQIFQWGRLFLSTEGSESEHSPCIGWEKNGSGIITILYTDNFGFKGFSILLGRRIERSRKLATSSLKNWPQNCTNCTKVRKSVDHPMDIHSGGIHAESWRSIKLWVRLIGFSINLPARVQMLCSERQQKSVRYGGAITSFSSIFNLLELNLTRFFQENHL